MHPDMHNMVLLLLRLLCVCRALVTNIRKRRGSHVCIRVPIFRDTNTVIKSATDAAATATTTSAAASAAPTPAASAAGDAAASAVATGAGGGAGAAAGASAAGSDDSKPCGPASDDTDGFVHMDAMAFGMGCCCLQVRSELCLFAAWWSELDAHVHPPPCCVCPQVTFQARDLAESRRLYDHLAVLSPVVVCIGSPFTRASSTPIMPHPPPSPATPSWTDGIDCRLCRVQGPPSRC